MKTSKLIYVLLLALLLQTIVAQIFGGQSGAPTQPVLIRPISTTTMATTVSTNINTLTQADINPTTSEVKKIINGLSNLARNSCKSQGGDRCKPQVPALGITGTPEIASQLRAYWKTRRAQNILRRLFSVNNQYPSIDEGNIVAWENNYMYLAMGNSFKIIQFIGPNLKQVYSQNLPSGQVVSQVVVSNEFFALYLQIQTSPASPVIQSAIRLYRHNPPTTVTFIKQFKREGFLVSIREQNGYLHVVTQYWQITDLGWDLSGMGYMGANLSFCASWDGNGNWVRNIAAISLSINPTYTLDAYLGCDRAIQASLTPSGNWYVASQFSDISSFGSLIQKVYWASPTPSQWAGLPAVYLGSLGGGQNNHWDEHGGCTLRVAGREKSNGGLLKLFAFDCTGFNQIATSGWVGPSGSSLQTVRWIGQNVYATFSNEASIWKYEQGSNNFVYRGTLYGRHYISALYQYGPSHMIGLGFPDLNGILNFKQSSVILIDLTSFATVIQYNILPKTASFLSTNNHERSHQFIDVDFTNKRIVFPIQSNEEEPFAQGFYYLHIEVGPTPCMTAPPITPCSTAHIQNHYLANKMVKHWNQVGQLWLTTPSQTAYRFVTRPYGSLQYLYSYGPCQLQVHEDPVSTGVLNFQPISFLDFCP